LYRHPTHPLVGRGAERALRIGRVTGREDEVLDAFRHVSSIPLEFDVKRELVHQGHPKLAGQVSRAGGGEAL
jgi:hypothetical protein